MANELKNRVEDYIGTVSDTTALGAWLTAGAKVIVDKIPLEKAERFSTTVTDAGSGIDVSGNRVIRAHKSNVRANIIDAGLASQAADSTSIHYATSTDPSAYITGTKLYVLPSGGTGVVIPYPTVAYTATNVDTNFPTELEEAVVLYAAIRGLQQKINVLITTTLDAITITLPTAPTAPTVPTFTYSSASAQGISTVTIDLSLLTPPDYTKVTGSLDIATNQAKPTAPDFTGITAPTAPSAPTISYSNASATAVSANTIGASPTFTDYTDSIPSMPVFNLDRTGVPTAPAFTDIDTDIAHTDVTVETMVANSALDLTTQLDTELATMLDTNFDIEAANAKLNEARTRIEEFQAEASVALQQAIENARNSNDINKFNEVQTLSANINNYQLLLSKYSNQLGSWQSDMNAQYQQHQLNLQAWEREAQNQLFSSLNTFNSKNAEYQAELNKVIEQTRVTLQEAITDANNTTNIDLQNKIYTFQAAVQDYVQELEKYKADQSNYVVKVNKVIDEYRALVEAWNIDRVTILQEASTKMQDELHDQNIANIEYQTLVQEKFKEADLNLTELVEEARLTTDVNKQNAIYSYLAAVEETKQDIANYATQVNSYSVETNGVVQEFTQKINQLIAQHEGLLKQKEELQKLYNQELQLHLG